MSQFGEIQHAWQCPRCQKINAPWSAQCSCQSFGTTGTGCQHEWRQGDTTATEWHCVKCGERRTDLPPPEGTWSMGSYTIT